VFDRLHRNAEDHHASPAGYQRLEAALPPGAAEEQTAEEFFGIEHRESSCIP
jgi:hypothetical protein